MQNSHFFLNESLSRFFIYWSRLGLEWSLLFWWIAKNQQAHSKFRSVMSRNQIHNFCLDTYLFLMHIIARFCWGICTLDLMFMQMRESAWKWKFDIFKDCEPTKNSILGDNNNTEKTEGRNFYEQSTIEFKWTLFFTSFWIFAGAVDYREYWYILALNLNAVA